MEKLFCFKRLPVYIILVVLLAMPAFSFGDEGENNGPGNRGLEKRIEKLDERENREEERVERKEEKKQERLEKLDERRKKIIRAFWNRMVKRIEAVMERQRKFIDRIESRMDKFEEKGKDVSAARDQLGIGKNKLEEAINLLGSAKDRAGDALEDDSPKQAFVSVRPIVKEVIDAIKDAHKAIVETLGILRGASQDQLPSPSPTASPSPSPSPTASPSPSPSPSASPSPSPTASPTSTP